MSIITTHDDKTEVTGLTKDNDFHTVDLSSYVSEGCLGLSLQFVNNNLDGVKEASHRTTGLEDDGRLLKLAILSYQNIIAKLDENYQIDLKLEDSDVDVFILAEFYEGIVLRDTDDYLLHPQLSGWNTVTTQPLGSDTYDDVEAAIVYGHKSNGTQSFGVRALGSTEELVSLVEYQQGSVPVKTNSNGQYQIYIPSAGCGLPDVWGIEIGYIKKNYGFTVLFDPENFTLSDNDDWEEFSLDGLISDYSTHAVLRLIGGCFFSGVRAVGSTNPSDNLSVALWGVYWSKVDEDLKLEYRQNAGTVDYSVWGYVSVEPPPEPEPEPEPEYLSLDILDRFVASFGPRMVEVLNLTNVSDEDVIVTQMQNPEYGFGVITSDGTAITSAINLSIFGRIVTINSADLSEDHDVILMIFGY